MFFSILKWVFISLTLIFLIHHLYLFLMDTLTVPKIKDLVHKPTQQYQAIFDTLGTKTTDSMTDELSSFLSDLKKTTLAPAIQKNETLHNNDSLYSIY